jgi:hypothetical protein
MITGMRIVGLGAVVALGLTNQSWAQGANGAGSNSGALQGPGQQQMDQERGLSGSTVGRGGIIPGDSSNGLPDAPNANTGGSPNNPNPGPTDRAANVPSDNR